MAAIIDQLEDLVCHSRRSVKTNTKVLPVENGLKNKYVYIMPLRVLRISPEKRDSK
jgi:hypothetical protein